MLRHEVPVTTEQNPGVEILKIQDSAAVSQDAHKSVTTVTPMRCHQFSRPSCIVILLECLICHLAPLCQCRPSWTAFLAPISTTHSTHTHSYTHIHTCAHVHCPITPIHFFQIQLKYYFFKKALPCHPHPHNMSSYSMVSHTNFFFLTHLQTSIELWPSDMSLYPPWWQELSLLYTIHCTPNPEPSIWYKGSNKGSKCNNELIGQQKNTHRLKFLVSWSLKVCFHLPNAAHPSANFCYSPLTFIILFQCIVLTDPTALASLPRIFCLWQSQPSMSV